MQRCCRSAAALLEWCCRITNRPYIPNFKFLGQVYVLECCRHAAGMLLRCCRSAAPLLERSCRITFSCYIPNLKSLGQVIVLRVLQAYCSHTADMLQTCCCPAAEKLQNHLEMIHTKFEVCRSSVTCSRVLQNFCRSDLLQIMKAHCVEMTHAKFEVSRSHHLGAICDYPKLAPPPLPPTPPMTPSIIKLA